MVSQPDGHAVRAEVGRSQVEQEALVDAPNLIVVGLDGPAARALRDFIASEQQLEVQVDPSHHFRDDAELLA